MNSTNCSKCSTVFNYQFWERLRKAREARGLTQRQVAERLGYDVKRYNNYETNRIPNLEDIIKIADILNCDVEYLCGMQGDYYRRESKTITEATGLSQDAAESLVELTDKNNLALAKVLCALLIDERFKTLLRYIWAYRKMSKETNDMWLYRDMWDFQIYDLVRDMYKDIDPDIFK